MFVIRRPPAGKNSKEERVLEQQKQRCKPGRCDTSKRRESLKAKSAVKEVNGKNKTKHKTQTKQKTKLG